MHISEGPKDSKQRNIWYLTKYESVGDRTRVGGCRGLIVLVHCCGDSPGPECVECMKNGIMFDVAKSHFMFVWSSVTLCRTGDSVRFDILNTHIVHQVCST